MQSFARIQADVVSLAMRELLPKLLAARPRSEEARRALVLLGKWDGAMRPERAEPLIAWAWWRELTRAIYADELGDAFRANWLARAPFLGKVLSGDPALARWCDDVRTPATETCEEVLALSLDAALADLGKRYGADPARWRWGEAHVARHEHRPFGRQPLLARLFDITVPSPGDAFTVNVGRNNFNDEAQPFANRLALHPLGRPVGQHPVGPLPRVHAGLGEERVHPDARRAQNPRRRAASAAAAAAGALIDQRRFLEEAA